MARGDVLNNLAAQLGIVDSIIDDIAAYTAAASSVRAATCSLTTSARRVSHRSARWLLVVRSQNPAWKVLVDAHVAVKDAELVGTHAHFEQIQCRHEFLTCVARRACVFAIPV